MLYYTPFAVRNKPIDLCCTMSINNTIIIIIIPFIMTSNCTYNYCHFEQAERVNIIDLCCYIIALTPDWFIHVCSSRTKQFENIFNIKLLTFWRKETVRLVNPIVGLNYEHFDKFMPSTAFWDVLVQQNVCIKYHDGVRFPVY